MVSYSRVYIKSNKLEFFKKIYLEYLRFKHSFMNDFKNIKNILKICWELELPKEYCSLKALNCLSFIACVCMCISLS